MPTSRLIKLIPVGLIIAFLQGCDDTPKSGPLDGNMVYCDPLNDELPMIFSFSEGKVFQQVWLIIEDELFGTNLQKASDNYSVIQENIRWHSGDDPAVTYEMPRDTLELRREFVYEGKSIAGLKKYARCRAIETQQDYHALVEKAEKLGEQKLAAIKKNRKL